MPSPHDQTSSTSAYASDKPKDTSSRPKPTKPAAAKPAPRRSAAAEINYPDPLPGGFMPGKKSLLF
ncbi:hypothetical protein ANO14919_012480 [Xylariales sp. No.14919]|nr:hypothetical protein ANO14919_012480 [Xylariales sp. No.14919]